MRGVALAALALLGLCPAGVALAADPPTWNGNPVGGVASLCISADGRTAMPCSLASAIPMTFLPLGAGSNGAATIATAGSLQVAFAAGSIQHGAFIQNPPNSGQPLTVDQCGDVGQVATACIEVLQPGQTWETRPGQVPATAVTVTGPTTGQGLYGARY